MLVIEMLPESSAPNILRQRQGTVKLKRARPSQSRVALSKKFSKFRAKTEKFRPGFSRVLQLGL
jgi:hypothetical protein